MLVFELFARQSFNILYFCCSMQFVDVDLRSLESLQLSEQHGEVQRRRRKEIFQPERMSLVLYDISNSTGNDQIIHHL